MNEELKNMADVTRAACEGATIEIRYRDSAEWKTLDHINCHCLWNWTKFDYRVKEHHSPRILHGIESDKKPILSAFISLHRAAVDYCQGEDEEVRHVKFIELTPAVKQKLGYDLFHNDE